MRFKLLAAMLAAFLAVSTASTAADRPVGPEAGQARNADGGGFDHPSDPDDVGAFGWHNYGAPTEAGLTFAGWFRALARMFNCGIRGINTPC